FLPGFCCNDSSTLRTFHLLVMDGFHFCLYGLPAGSAVCLSFTGIVEYILFLPECFIPYPLTEICRRLCHLVHDMVNLLDLFTVHYRCLPVIYCPGYRTSGLWFIKSQIF